MTEIQKRVAHAAVIREVSGEFQSSSFAVTQSSPWIFTKSDVLYALTQYVEVPMRGFQIYFVLFAILGITGCVTDSHEPATRFFSNSNDLALAKSLEKSDWLGAEQAVKAGADVNQVGKEGMYPLEWAMYLKNKKAFEWLLNHGANPNISAHNDLHDEDVSVLFLSAQANDADWLRMLVAHKANPDLQRQGVVPGDIKTPLKAAVMQRRIEQVKILIAAGADVNYSGPKGSGLGTAALDAASIGFFEGAYALIEAGTNVKIRTKGGDDLASFVAFRKLDPDNPQYPWRQKVLQQLRDRGVDVDAAIKKVNDEEELDRKQNPWRYNQ